MSSYVPACELLRDLYGPITKQDMYYDHQYLHYFPDGWGIFCLEILTVTFRMKEEKSLNGQMFNLHIYSTKENLLHQLGVERTDVE